MPTVADAAIAADYEELFDEAAGYVDELVRVSRRARHRDKILEDDAPFSACVARPVKPMELKTNQKARDAMRDE